GGGTRRRRRPRAPREDTPARAHGAGVSHGRAGEPRLSLPAIAGELPPREGGGRGQGTRGAGAGGHPRARRRRGRLPGPPAHLDRAARDERAGARRPRYGLSISATLLRTLADWRSGGEESRR